MNSTQKQSTKTFLDKLSVLNYKFKQRESYEEDFNIFKALHHINDEVRLHSRFISVLLSMDRKTGEKNLFLKLFLDHLKIDHFENLKDIEVYPNEHNKSEYRDIDILIIDRTQKKAIIIENKIYAGDSNNEENGQLERYVDRIIDEGIPDRNIKVFYLSIDGREPSSESLGRYQTLENINGRILDYEINIKNWLDLCLTECINEPFVRESILQYIKLINDMTSNTTEIQERKEIRDLIGSSQENMDSTKLLVENFKHVKWHTVRDFWDEIIHRLGQNSFNVINQNSLTDEDISRTTHKENSNHSYSLYFKNESGINLYLWNGGYSEPLSWGIMKNALNDNQNKKMMKHEDFKTLDDNYLTFPNFEEDETIYFSDFSKKGTFNLINKDYRKITIDRLVNEIKETVKSLGF